MPPNTVSVCRPGIFGNPFVVGKNGTAAECVEKFRLFLGGRIADMLGGPAIIREAQERLRGKNLACFCALDQPCHADVLLEVSNQNIAGCGK